LDVSVRVAAAMLSYFFSFPQPLLAKNIQAFLGVRLSSLLRARLHLAIYATIFITRASLDAATPACFRSAQPPIQRLTPYTYGI